MTDAPAPDLGRPPLDIDATCDLGPGGQEITMREALLQRISVGLHLIDAATSVNLSMGALRDWRQQGAIHRAREAAGQRLSVKEQRYADFGRELERAEVEAELARVSIIHRVARGGTLITKTVTKYDAATPPNVIERTVTEETLAPNWQAAAWWLERRRGYVRRFEMVPPGGPIPIEDVADTLARSLQAYLAGVEDGVVTVETDA